MEPLKVSAGDARELAHMRPGQGFDGMAVVLNEQVGSRRWVSEHHLVISTGNGDDIRYWGAGYDQGLTENQETRPFDDVDMVDFYPQVRREVVRYVYEDAKP